MNYLCIVLTLLLSACMTVDTPGERRSLADSLAAQRDWHRERLPAGPFDLVAYLPSSQTLTEILTVYIEGDGFAWITGSQPSSDPTPRDPLALRLALAQPDSAAVYLARPCQYVDAEVTGCASRYWTGSRFAPEVVGATNQAIDTLKQRFHARRLILVGYSGGGTVAMLVAARRNDLELVVTVAGNLDIRAWTTYHRILPLDGSLNPADEIDVLQKIPRLHLVGEIDDVVPPPLAVNFARLFTVGSKPIIEIEPMFNHRCCWVNNWASLWRKIRGRQW